MKKSSILFSVLIVITTLLFVSCSALTSNKTQTGNFTYTIDENLINAIERANEPGNQGGLTPVAKPLYTLNISIKSKVPGVYDNYQSKEDIMSVLKETTFQFNDIPLNTPLLLSVSVYSNGNLLYLSNTVEFTLTSDAVKEIEAILSVELNTPMLTWNDSDIYYIDGSGLPVSFNDSCFDRDGNLWYVQNSTIGYVPAGTTEVKSTNVSGIYFSNIDFDPATDKLWLTSQDYNNIRSYSITPQAVQNTINNNQALSISTNDLKTVADIREESETLLTYAYNDMFYTFSFYNEMNNPDIRLSRFSAATSEYTTGSLTDYNDNWNDDVQYAFCEPIPEISSSVLRDGSDFSTKFDFTVYYTTFTDMAAYQDSIFLLFHQEYASNGGEGSDTQYPFFTDRGGILVIDAETLKVTDVIGLEAAKSSVKVPAIGYGSYVTKEGIGNDEKTDYYTSPAFQDAGLSKRIWQEADVTWAVGERNGRTLRYPEKIIAIKPRKLVIADTGNFYYIDSDGFCMEEGSRIVSVDLESFAVTVENNNSSIPSQRLVNGFTLTSGTKTLDMNDKVYGYSPIINEEDYTISGYNEHKSAAFPNSCDFSIGAEIPFGETGV